VVQCDSRNKSVQAQPHNRSIILRPSARVKIVEVGDASDGSVNSRGRPKDEKEKKGPRLREKKSQRRSQRRPPERRAFPGESNMASRSHPFRRCLLDWERREPPSFVVVPPPSPYPSPTPSPFPHPQSSRSSTSLSLSLSLLESATLGPRAADARTSR
jgi:hypothetical protein